MTGQEPAENGQELRKNICAVCGGEDWEPLDEVMVPCGICMRDGKKDDCKQCGGKGEFLYKLRDQKYWYSQSYLYKEKIGFQACRKCGFLTYAPRWTPDEWIKKQGRAPLDEKIIITNMRRSRILEHFLERNLPGFYEMTALEINGGTGENSRIFDAYQNNDINIKFETYSKEVNKETGVSLPADIVIMYYCLQQADDPSGALLSAKQSICENGYLYVEVPEYLRDLHDVFGRGATHFELVYHPNFNNCFTQTSIRNLFDSVGLDIVATEPTINGERFLLQKRKESRPFVLENIEKVDDIKKILVMQSQALSLAMEGQTIGQEVKSRDEALKLLHRAVDTYPQYLDGWLLLSTHQEYYRDVKKLKVIFDKADQYLTHKERLYTHFANLFKNWGEAGLETTWTKMAEDLYGKVLEMNPGNAEALLGMLYIKALVNLDIKSAIGFHDRLIEVSPESWTRAKSIITLYYQNNVRHSN